MDELATRCRTVATRLSKPHSEHIKDAAFDHLHEAAAALAASAARIAALTEALRKIEGLEGLFQGNISTAWMMRNIARAAIAQPSRGD